MTTITAAYTRILTVPIKSGDFPAPIRLGGTGSRAVGWRRTEIQAWIDERPRDAAGELFARGAELRTVMNATARSST